MASLLRLLPSIFFKYLQNAYQVFVHWDVCFSVMKVREDPLDQKSEIPRNTSSLSGD